MRQKRLEVKLSGDQGQVEAVFARFNVVDHDGDVTIPGAFTDGQKVRISAYNHGSWQGALPVGKGVISQNDEAATLHGEFFMNTAGGRDTFEVVKQLEDLGEWSYGFDVAEESSGTFEGQSVRFLKRLDVHEVSPVLLGAGIGTQTVAMKSRDMSDEDLLRAVKQHMAEVKERGLPIPGDLIAAVHELDARIAEENSREGMLMLIASAHGINYEGTGV